MSREKLEKSNVINSKIVEYTLFNLIKLIEMD